MLLAAAAVIGVSNPAAAQQVLAVVNGTPITSYDVEQRSKLIVLSTRKSLSHKEVLEELINERLKIAEGKKYTLSITGADVDRAFANMASRMGLKPAQLEQALTSHGVSVQTLKSRILADLTWGQLVRGRFQQTLLVSDSEVQAAINQKPEGKDAVGYIYTLRPIVFIVPKGSPPSAFDLRRREAEQFRGRVNGCDNAVAFARGLRDVAVRDQIFRNSADLPEQARKTLGSLAIGQVSTPETTAQGVEVFAICARKETKATTPLRAEIKEEMFAKRYEAQSKHYLAQIRRSAMIEYKHSVR
jgi:peptidyl-prolyl cis-trans isomerase SurA